MRAPVTAQRSSIAGPGRARRHGLSDDLGARTGPARRPVDNVAALASDQDRYGPKGAAGPVTPSRPAIAAHRLARRAGCHAVQGFGAAIPPARLGLCG